MATRTRTHFLALLIGAGLAGGLVAPSFAQNDIGVAPGNDAGIKVPGSTQSSGPSESTEVKDAEALLNKEDPTKIVKKVTDPSMLKQDSDMPVEMQANGMWLDKDGNPTPYIEKDGKMGWFTFSGYRRYGANCLVCHGPDAMGSSYAPALIDSLKTLSYPEFLQTVAMGKKNVSNSQDLVMPSFGDNKNVECYINDIYVYIRARALGILNREQPTKHLEKPALYAAQETACLGF